MTGGKGGGSASEGTQRMTGGRDPSGITLDYFMACFSRMFTFNFESNFDVLSGHSGKFFLCLAFLHLV